jgi:mannosyltransferase
MKRTALILLLILLAATALRLYRLNDGLWLDEILTDVSFVRMPAAQIVTTFESENQHFLYSLMAHAAYQAFGPSPWALRLPAVIFGVGSILALYLFARQVTSVTEALSAAALLAFSYHHVWFSQNARGYTGLLFWTLVSSWLLLVSLKSDRPRDWLLFAGSLALGLYTHMTMAFPILGEVVLYGVVLLRDRGKQPRRAWWRGLLLGFGAGAGFTLLLYAPVLGEMLGGMGREASLVAEWKNPLWTLMEIVRGLEIGFYGGLAALIALAVFGAGLVSYLRTRWEVPLLLLVPALACAGLVIALGHHFWPRFFFFAFGFAALVAIRGAVVVGRAAGRILRWPPVRTERLAALAGVGMVLVSAASVPFAYGPKQDYAGAMQYVQAQRQPGDAIAISGLATLPYKDYYRADWQVVDNLPQLRGLAANAPRTWFVYTMPPVLEATAPDILAAVEADFTPVKSFDGTLGGGTVYVARVDGPIPGE